jgi:hypothetical protein
MPDRAKPPDPGDFITPVDALRPVAASYGVLAWILAGFEALAAHYPSSPEAIKATDNARAWLAITKEAILTAAANYAPAPGQQPRAGGPTT